MTINAQDIVQRIGTGVAEALNTSRLFLGVEVDASQNANIHPEYVTTVEVAKKFTAPDWHVSLETHMKELRRQARGLAWMRHGMTREAAKEIDAILARYRFGKKDSKRLDILVRSADTLKPPILIAEAKLGVENLSGVIDDIHRVIALLEMYHEVGLLDKDDVYGSVLFHSMEEGNATGSGSVKAQSLLAGVQGHLSSLIASKSWLRAKAGLLTYGAQVQPVAGYKEVHEDGTEGDVFAKESFTFAPGLVLLGNATDINTVTF